MDATASAHGKSNANVKLALAALGTVDGAIGTSSLCADVMGVQL